MDDQDERWSELILELYGHRDVLVERFLAQMRLRGDYDSYGVTREDLEATAFKAYEAILRYVVESDPAHDPRLDLAATLGRRRARQHVALDDLGVVISIDFQVIWQLLCELADPADDSLLVRKVADLWEAVDGFRRATEEKYHAEAMGMAGELAKEREALLRDFLGSTVPSEPAVNSVAKAFGLDPGGGYTACAGLERERLGGALQAMESFSKRVITWTDADDGWMVFWPSDLQGAPLRGLEGVSCGYLDGVDGLGRVPESLRVVRSFMRVVGDRADEGPMDIEERWALLVSLDLSAAIPSLFAGISDRLSRSRSQERSRIIETVGSYMRTGSVSETARECFCHRNTVLNRIKAFGELTSLDLNVPGDLALAYLFVEKTGGSLVVEGA